MAGGNPQLAVKITANIEALKAALQLTQTELMKTAAGAAAISGQFSGAKLEQQALQTAVAIKALGGAVTLTGAEAQRADAVFTAWLDKAAKSGKAVEPEFAKIAAETKKIADQAKLTEAALAAEKAELQKTTAAAAELTKSLSGGQLQKDAQAMATAIKTVGGATTLTGAEAKRADTIFREWLEKAAKTGQAVPPEMAKIAAETRRVAEEAGKAEEKHKSWFATIAGGTAVGHMLAEGLTKAAEIAVDALKEVVKWLGEIALEGSRELGIEKAFKRLTTGAGQDGLKLLHDLQKATHGTIEESALMVRVNENLATGMRLSNEQYIVMAKGAFALAKATGTDVKEALDKMSDAMITGRTRAVALITGKIDAKDAEEKFAKALGRTAEELSAEGKIEATRQAILQGVGRTVDRLGEQTDGLGTKVKQAKVQWKDFQDELGKAVAGSPVLMTVVNNIGEVLSKAFGVAREEAVRRLGMAIDELAISAVGLAADLAPAIGVIGTEFNALQVVARNVLQFLDLMLLGIKQIALAGVEAIDAMTPGEQFANQQVRLRTEIAALRVEMIKRKDAMDEDKKAEDEWWNLGERLKVQLTEMQAKMEASRRRYDEHREATEKNTAAAGENAEAAAQNTAAFFNAGEGAGEAAKKLKTLTEESAKMATALATLQAQGATPEEIAKALGGWAEGIKAKYAELSMEVPAAVQETADKVKAIVLGLKIADWMEQQRVDIRKSLEASAKDTEALVAKQREAINKGFVGNLDVQAKAQDDLTKLEADSLEKRLALVRADMDKRRAALDKNASNYESALAEVNRLEEKAAADATQAWLDHVAALKEKMAPSFLAIFKDALNGIPDIIKAAFTGGGGVGGAVSAILSDLGGALGEKLGGMLARALDGPLGKLGAKVGGAIFDMIPGIGGALGSMIMPALDKAWGWISKREGRQVNDLRDAYVAAAGGFDKLAEQARKAGIELNSSSAFQRASTTEAWQKAVAELDAALKKSTEDRKKMLAAVMAGERLATQAFITEMENLAAAGGEAAKEATDYFNATLKTAASGLTAMFAGLEKGATSAAQAAAVKLHMAAGMAEADAKKAAEGITGIFVKTQAQATGLAGAIAGTFAKMMENGASFREALAAIKGPLDTMRKQLELTGLSGGAAFENLSRMGQIADGQITGPLMDAIDGANQALIGLSNSGLMNQETFAALATTATDAYNQIIAQGVDGQAALQMMQPTLQTMWEMQQQFGYEVDAATQALIDEAVAAGQVGEAHMSAQERAAKSMEKVATIMEAIARKMGVDLPAAAQSAADGINRAFDRVDPRVPPPWDGWGPPPDIEIDYSFNPVGEPPPGMASGGVVYAAGGWMQPKGSDIVPAMLTPGERVLTVGQNYDYEHRMRTSTATTEAPPANINITIQALDPLGLKQVVEREVGPLLVSAFRRNVNGLRTDTRKELVE